MRAHACVRLHSRWMAVVLLLISWWALDAGTAAAFSAAPRKLVASVPPNHEDMSTNASSSSWLQVPSSQSRRVRRFLEEKGYEVGESVRLRSLAFLEVLGTDAVELTDRWWGEWEPEIPLRRLGVIRKIYGVDPSFSSGVEMSEREALARAAELWARAEEEDGGRPARVKLNLFPPSRVPEWTAGLLEVPAPKIAGRLSPTHPTHILSALELPSGAGEEETRWCLGMTPAPAGPPTPDDGRFSKPAISRARYKLEEALARYSSGRLPAGKGLVAVDCGAAPGGWTQVLAEHPSLDCRKIVAIDPGDLAPELLRDHPDTVVHLRATVEATLAGGRLAAAPVDVWVSDMCLHETGGQIDALLDARREGVVEPGTFFVLTLKCNKGHSEAGYEAQATALVEERLPESVCDKLEVLHLFSNRLGERTLMGYLK